MADQGEQLRQQFEGLIQRFSEQGIIDVFALEPAAHAFFDAHVGDTDPGKAPDTFFGSFGYIWEELLRRRLYGPAEQLWHDAVAIACRWESAHHSQLIHKGLPFYFWGGTAILSGNIRKGFLLIHASLDEDSRKHYRHDENPDTPASNS